MEEVYQEPRTQGVWAGGCWRGRWVPWHWWEMPEQDKGSMGAAKPTTFNLGFSIAFSNNLMGLGRDRCFAEDQVLEEAILSPLFCISNSTDWGVTASIVYTAHTPRSSSLFLRLPFEALTLFTLKGESQKRRKRLGLSHQLHKTIRLINNGL